MQVNDKSPEDSTSSEFMLEEYRMLRERFHSLRNEGVNRLSFFIALTSAVIGGVLVLGNNIPLASFRLILFAALVLLASVGLDVVQFMVTRDSVTDRVERGMNRVRRYYIQHDPSLKDFVIFPYHDEPTSYITKQRVLGIRRTALTVQSFAVGLAVGVIADWLNLQFRVSVVLGLIAFAANFVILEQNAKRKLEKALDQAKSNVKFPKSQGEGETSRNNQTRLASRVSAPDTHTQPTRFARSHEGRLVHSDCHPCSHRIGTALVWSAGSTLAAQLPKASAEIPL